MKIRMVGESTFLGKTFAADVARVRSLTRVDAHVSDESVVNSELTLTNLTAIGFLVGVGTVVQRQLCGRMVKRVLFKERERKLEIVVTNTFVNITATQVKVYQCNRYDYNLTI